MMGDTKIIKLVRPFWKIGSRNAKADAQFNAPSADEIQRHYLRPVLNYVAGRIGKSDDEAEDITAEVFAAAFASLHKCPVPKGENNELASYFPSDPVRAWLFGIARRKVADFYRQKARRPQIQTNLLETEIAPAHDEPEPAFMTNEAHQTLRELLSGLPEVQREAIALRYIDGLSVEDTAQVLSKSPNATAQLLHRARQTLRTRGAAYFNASEDTEAPK